MIWFNLTTLNNKSHPCRCVIIDEDGVLGKSVDVTNVLVGDFIIDMETTEVDALRLNGNIGWRNRSIHKIIRVGLIDGNQNEKKWFYAAETSNVLYRWIIHSALDNTSSRFVWYRNNPIINKLRTLLCDIYPIKPSSKI